MSHPVYGLNELREMFLRFFESKGHLRLPSFSLIPQNDKSILLINAGMTPMKPWFKGEEEPPRRRVCTCQKCIRTGDIDNVGHTARHGTFFEMLGNFSFGDYFKHEAIAWSWEFLTSPEWVGLEPDRLYPSVFAGSETTPADDEAFAIWRDEVGIPAERIFRFGKEDNFWEHGSGPCGPCSEIYFDRGLKYGCGKPTCGVGCDCDRFMEIWNLVFSQYDSDGKGTYALLPKPNIDTGMGLERLAVVMQDVDNLFEVDTVAAVLHHVERISGKQYGANEKDDISIRVITDHIRATVFMASDGILPSNEGRGYVLRRLIRRAFRFGRLMGMQEPFLYKTALKVVEVMGEDYPELRARAAWKGSGEKDIASRFQGLLEDGLKSEFFGYTALTGVGRVVALLDGDGLPVEALPSGSLGYVVTDQTPFYGASGGQCGDTGLLTAPAGSAKVLDTLKPSADLTVHHIEVDGGTLLSDQEVVLTVTESIRLDAARNHTCTHLLHAALRRVLGDHVRQAGSLVTPDRLRFDFSHIAPMTPEELAAVERDVNAAIMADYPLTAKLMGQQAAIDMGAMALFGEKYGSVVRMVKMGDFSTELCGGTHASNTAKLGLFKIISETGIAAGVRRIEGTTGLGVLALLSERDTLISETAKELKAANVHDIARRAAALQTELRSAKRETEVLNSRIAAMQTEAILGSAVEVGAVKVVTKQTSGSGVDTARAICDEIKASHDDYVVVISTDCDGKLNFTCACGKAAVAAGANAGAILREISAIAGGKGGGRPDSATSGAKDADKIPAALAAVADTVRGMLK